MFNWTQERYFLITNEKIYNIKKAKIKRAIVVSNYSLIVLDKWPCWDNKDVERHEERI